MNINLQQMAIDLKLTNIQIIGIHNIGWRIKSGRDDYSSYEDALSEAESKYLVAWLAKNGIAVDKEGGRTLTGEDAAKWFKEHGKAEG